MTAAEALAHLPTMPAERLASAYLYYDARADDARLCLTVARTAAAHGAVVANHAAVDGHHQGRRRHASTGATVRGRRRHHRRAGPRRRQRRRRVGRRRPRPRRGHPPRFDPAGQGRPHHGAVDKVRNDIAVVIPVPKDRRSLFVVPWGRRCTYVGTTDTDYDGPLDDPQCTPEDIAYVLRALNRSITTGVTEADIVGTWAGLRPLVKRQAGGPHRRPVPPPPRHRLSRARRHRHRRQADDLPADGGRHRRRRDGAARPAGPVAAPSASRLAGRRGLPSNRPTAPTPPPTSPAATAARRRHVEALARRRTRRSARPLVPGLPYLAAEAVYAARHEMAHHARRRAVPAHARPTPRPRRVGGGGARRRPPAGARAGLGRRRVRAPGPQLRRRRRRTSATPPGSRAAVDAMLGA